MKNEHELSHNERHALNDQRRGKRVSLPFFVAIFSSVILLILVEWDVAAVIKQYECSFLIIAILAGLCTHWYLKDPHDD